MSFFSSLLAGLLIVVGPLYLETSIHLRMPYTGTPLGVYRVVLPGTELAHIGPGDQVLVVRSPDSNETVGKNRVVRLDARTALPTRWSHWP